MEDSGIHHSPREDRGYSIPVDGERIREGVEGRPTKYHTHSRGMGADHPTDCNQGVHRRAKEDERVDLGHAHPVRTRQEAQERIRVCPDARLQSPPIVLLYLNA